MKQVLALAALLTSAAAWVSLAAPGDSIAELKSAVAAVQSRQNAAAIAALNPLAAKFPQLRDYIAWFQASAQFDALQYSDVSKTLEPVWKQTPTSPLLGRSALLAAQAYVRANNPHSAVELLRKRYNRLSQPQGDAALATALAADGDAVAAAVYQQRVYYSYPLSAEAAQAESELARLKSELGPRYPPVLGTVIVGRAMKLLDASQYAKARQEFTAMLGDIAGPERDTALVKLGVADYLQKRTPQAQRYLSTLTVDAPEADAERLHYLVLCARRGNDRDAAQANLEELTRRYPDSPWRLRSLVAIADSFLVENQFEVYEPLYRSCYEVFPTDRAASGCHWKVAAGHYLRRAPDAAALLREHLERYPSSEDSPAALYFLGRLAQDASDTASARALYGSLRREFPNHYHAELAQDRMTELNASNGVDALRPVAFAQPAAATILRNVAFPERLRARSFEPNAMGKIRLERARLLASAGLDEWADVELRYAAQNEDQPHLMAWELASMARRKDAPDQAIRFLKRYASDYLYIPLESAPSDFWRLAFPLTYWAEIEKQANANGFDPYLLAALIRQESEFDPKATSVSSARGLTQILPGTGRELSRRLGIRPYSTARLFQPELNLRLGAYYLKSISDRFNGRWEAVLAAYNAGPSRANAWLMWGEFRDPAEFIEAVPFGQTRGYVQIVLRNASMYRRIYASGARQ